ncbi:hypothetical protein MIND_01209300 [Mycena indigotica]|uniref:Uncharacterized protein n=1 Tax=Mycena indigotica TaxID=2126181 RepID=A0A8H6VT97_9AGAR|nr:uncharacterized protein MIND_01209300 [Mycena indigotica]KAF7293099.1 hypothetical protein MIND_01209300 [Mycena indigotica]
MLYATKESCAGATSRGCRVRSKHTIFSCDSRATNPSFLNAYSAGCPSALCWAGVASKDEDAIHLLPQEGERLGEEQAPRWALVWETMLGDPLTFFPAIVTAPWTPALHDVRQLDAALSMLCWPESDQQGVGELSQQMGGYHGSGETRACGIAAQSYRSPQEQSTQVLHIHNMALSRIYSTHTDTCPSASPLVVLPMHLRSSFCGECPAASHDWAEILLGFSLRMRSTARSNGSQLHPQSYETPLLSVPFPPFLFPFPNRPATTDLLASKIRRRLSHAPAGNLPLARRGRRNPARKRYLKLESQDFVDCLESQPCSCSLWRLGAVGRLLAPLLLTVLVMWPARGCVLYPWYQRHDMGVTSIFPGMRRRKTRQCHHSPVFRVGGKACIC